MFRKYLRKLQALQLKALTKGINVDLCVRSADGLLPWAAVTVTKEGWTSQAKDEEGNAPGFYCAYVCMSGYLSREDNEKEMSAAVAKLEEKVEEFANLKFKEA